MRGVLRRLLPAECSSPLALGIFFPIGVLLIVLAAPVTLDASGVRSPLWWLMALAVQGAFSAIVLAVRARGWAVGPVVFAAGFGRGVVPPLCAPALLGIDVVAGDILLAGLTSGVACILWLGVIGNVLRARADYRREYADLARQAAQMRALSDNDVAGLDPAMGPWSTPSNTVTPTAPPPPPVAITITGSRGTGAERQVVFVTGTSTGLDGKQVRAHVRLRGQADYRPGRLVDVSAEGRFDWKRTTGKKTYVYFTGGDVQSNRVIVPAARR